VSATPRQRAAARVVEILDTPLLRALTEPARLQILRVLLASGSADVGTIADQLPQDRSVISRHLRTLEDAGIVRSRRDGRHCFYELDGGGFLSALERVTTEAKALAALCCPPAAGAKNDERRGPR